MSVGFRPSSGKACYRRNPWWRGSGESGDFVMDTTVRRSRCPWNKDLLFNPHQA